MTPTWDDDDYPAPPRLTLRAAGRVLRRGLALFGLVFGGLFLLILLRLVERPLYGRARPWTPHITQFVCRSAFIVLGLPLRAEGAPMPQLGAVVANHSSWLDIFALNASKRIYFVSKSEVARWPGIGWLARATGTVFIDRDRARAREQTDVFQTRLLDGHKLLFFPEGTSTDGCQVLKFKSSLFEAFFAKALRETMWIQPVCVIYAAPPDQDPRFYGWWGKISFAAHLIATLAPARQGHVEVHYLPPLRVADFAGRKPLAEACEASIRTRHRSILEGTVSLAPEEPGEPRHRCR